MTSSRSMGLFSILVAAGIFVACGDDEGNATSSSATAGTGGTGGTGATGGGGDGAGGTGGGPVCEESDTQDCFDGDAALIGIGNCLGGTQVCTADEEWGECTGQVLPETEDCNARGDEDCDGSACADTAWELFVTADTDVMLRDQVIAADGSIYVTGSVEGNGSFGGEAFTTAQAVLLAKLDDAGNVLWARTYGDSPDVKRGTAIALDPTDGSIVIAGLFSADIDLGGGPLMVAGTNDIFLARFDAASGDHIDSDVASPRAGLQGLPQGYREVYDMVVSTDGSIATVGGYAGNWGCITVGCVEQNPSNGLDGFFRTFDSDFGKLEMRQIGTTNTDFLLRITAHPTSGYLISGWHADPILVGTTNLLVRGAWVAHADPLGTPLWVTPFSGGGAFHGMFTTAPDTIVFTASYQDAPLVIEGMTYDPGNSRSGFVAKMDLMGQVQDHMVVEGTGDMTIRDAAGDADGNVYVLAYFDGENDLSPAMLPTTDPMHDLGLVFKLNSDLDVQYGKHYPGTGNGWVSRIGVHPGGELVVSGTFNGGSIDLDSGPVMTDKTAPQNDGYLFMMNP